jgi:hypothetical protein
VCFDRMEAGPAWSCSTTARASSRPAYEGWEMVRMGGVERVEVRLGGQLVGAWTHTGEADEEGFDTVWIAEA